VFLAGKELLRLDAVELRRVLLLRVGPRVVALDDQVRAGDASELAHQVFDALREAAELHRHGLALREVEPELHRGLQVRQDLPRARGERVQIAFSEVGSDRRARD
jgi:hypothetical protein